jgi:SET domain
MCRIKHAQCSILLLHYCTCLASIHRSAQVHFGASAGCQGSSGPSSAGNGQKAHDLFDWACAMVSSRAFCLVGKAGLKLVCMVPGHDLANHSHESNIQFRMLESTSSNEPAHAIVTTRPVARGEQLCLCYGKEKSNDILLESYGFIVPGNINDRLELGASGRWTGFGDVASDTAMLTPLLVRCLLRLGVAVAGASPSESAIATICSPQC